MKFEANNLLLYAVTDRAWLAGRTLAEQVNEAIKGGITCLQLREKRLSREAFLEEAKEIKKLAESAGIPLIINDDVSICLESDADGVHVGQSDMAAQDVRALLGPDKILGVSAQTVEQALAAEQAGADYLGVGAMFSTSTKLDAKTTSFETLKAICEAVTIPVVAIGGISEANVLELTGSGAKGIAVVSAVFAKPDIAEAARRLKGLAKQMTGVTEE
ncbi:thiamine phosphate synthase [Massiliimalia massiliensis]|uniref:thiamine phosphate synthase n=1 Tax=Massiliimalia massiliensis TaxID=1852384 RepID=UPI000985DDFA|nr:thiamine phosphate synthase [Massiliimalia massiliensis]MBS1473427.1 thiamine phosphate synthase [Massiliimalia sp.]